MCFKKYQIISIISSSNVATSFSEHKEKLGGIGSFWRHINFMLVADSSCAHAAAFTPLQVAVTSEQTDACDFHCKFAAVHFAHWFRRRHAVMGKEELKFGAHTVDAPFGPELEFMSALTAIVVVGQIVALWNFLK